MTFQKIAPLGARNGPGTFDCIYKKDRYSTMDEAESNNDFVKIDFVKGEDNIIYFEFSYSKSLDIKVHEPLMIQHFPFGIDVFDDQNAMNIASKMLEEFH